MHYARSTCRTKFFKSLLETAPSNRKRSIILLFHGLPDLLDLYFGLDQIAHIRAVAIIPYSKTEKVIDALYDCTEILLPTLEELQSSIWWTATIDLYIPQGDEFAIVEVGGYACDHIEDIKRHCEKRFLGIVEDTESGHRKYQVLHAAGDLSCPVMSVARSEIKKAEDRAIGPAAIACC